MKPPFTVTGIDFAGPLYVKDKLGEDSKAYRIYAFLPVPQLEPYT